MASLAIMAADPLYPFSNTGISKHQPWVLIYSTAPALKLSHATNITEKLLFLNI